MLFFKIIFIILGSILSIFVLTILSILEIKIKNFKIDTRKKKKVEDRYLLEISLKLFGKLKWAKFTITKKRLYKIWNSKKVNKIKFNFLYKLFQKKTRDIEINEIKTLRMLQLKIKQLKLQLSYDTEDVIINSYLTAIIGSSIGILIGITQNEYKKKNYMYSITPIYVNQKFINLNLDCIFNVKMVHIINVIYLILQKRSEVNAGTSYRRTYDYSNE